MSFLGGLGSLAGGFNQSFSPYLQEYMQNQATGEGIYAAAGVPLPSSQSQPSSPGMGAVSSPQAQAPQAMQPVTTNPSLQMPTGVARGGSPQPAPQTQAPPSIQLPTGVARGQPMTAQPPAQAPQQPAPGPTGTAALAQQQQPPKPQPQQPPQQPQGDTAQFAGRFTPDQLVPHLLRTPGMTPTKLGAIVNSRGFQNMMSQEGLAQYRAAMGALGVGRLYQGQERIDETVRHGERDAAKQENLNSYRGKLMDWRQKAAGYGTSTRAIMQEARTKIASINAAVGRGDMEQKDAQKQIDAINTEMDKRLEAAGKGLDEPPKGEEGQSDDGMAEAKAAIAAGAPRDKVIARFKELHPDLDASGL